MLYQQEKLCFKKVKLEYSLPLLQPYCISHFLSLDGLLVQFKYAHSFVHGY
jgi:hypothetical protein